MVKYMFMGFNNYKISDLNRMYFNPSLGIYEGIILLKQGFYNYKYVIREKEKNFTKWYKWFICFD